MQLFNVIAGVSSVLSLLVSLFVAGRVLRIEQTIRVKGQRNVVAGRDVKL